MAVAALVPGLTPAVTHLQGASLQAGTNWPAYLFNVRHSSFDKADTAIGVGNAGTLTKLWSFTPPAGPNNTTGFVEGPAVVNGVVYIGGNNGTFYAINESNGQVEWSYTVGPVLRTTCGNRGFGDAPTVEPDPVTGAETVYVGAPNGYLYALDAATGAVDWASLMAQPSSTQNDYFDWSSPAVHNGTVYVGIASQCDAPLVPGSGLLAFDQHTGTKTAQFMTQAPGVIGGSIWSSAIVAPNGNVYVATGPGAPTDQFSGYADSIVELNPTTLAVVSSWQLPASATNGNDSDFGASPTLFTATINGKSTAMIANCNKNGIYYAFEQNNLTGGPVWQTRIGVAARNGTNNECISSAAWNGSDLFMAGDPTHINGQSYLGSIRELNPDTGAIVWATGLPGNVDGSPSLDGAGVLSVATFDFSGAPNADYLVSAATGAILATVSTGKSPEAAQPVYTGSDLLLASWRTTLYDYRAAP
jgi:polyvinyl alcohol dehydrogenase (cytochrome)